MYTVYLIENTLNHKLYVGVTSSSLENRWKEHCRDAGRDNYPFHNAIEKYGKENFDCLILEKTSSESKALELEKNYISKFKTYEYGYNSTKGGQGYSSGEDHFLAEYSDEEVVKIVNEYRTTRKSRKEVAEKYDITVYCLDCWSSGKNRSYLQSEFKEKENTCKGGVSDETVVEAVNEFRKTEKTLQQTAEKYDVTKASLENWHYERSRTHLSDKFVDHKKTYQAEAANKEVTDDEVVNAVVEYKTTKATQVSIASKYGVATASLSRWIRGEARCHLQEKITARIAYNSL